MSYKEVWEKYIDEPGHSPEVRERLLMGEQIREQVESGEKNGYVVVRKWCVTANGKPMYLARFDCGEEVGEMQLVISQQAWENLDSDTIG